jgi:hypothetical protein
MVTLARAIQNLKYVAVAQSEETPKSIKSMVTRTMSGDGLDMRAVMQLRMLCANLALDTIVKTWKPQKHHDGATTRKTNSI